MAAFLVVEDLLAQFSFWADSYLASSVETNLLLPEDHQPEDHQPEDHEPEDHLPEDARHAETVDLAELSRLLLPHQV
jgi:hypothetical protein